MHLAGLQNVKNEAFHLHLNQFLPYVDETPDLPNLHHFWHMNRPKIWGYLHLYGMKSFIFIPTWA